MKSRLAFEFSTRMFKQKFVYLWTFTFRRCLGVAMARKLWSCAAARFRKKKLLSGLRAFEMHPGGHGLHIHVITQEWTDVNDIRAVWVGKATDFEGGRIHVKRIPATEANYIAPYLTKERRPECLKGARMWAKIGDFDAEKVKDIVRTCRFTVAYSLCAAVIEGFREMSFSRRMMLCKNTAQNALRSELGATLIPLPIAI
jgi:hypothetical protein